MRKASFIIALSLITVFLTGHYFIYKSVLRSHKKEFKAYIRSQYAQIEQLEISPSELYTNSQKMTWLDDNKELCLNGLMYDILSIRFAGTKVILSVVNDKDEKELMNLYNRQFNTIYDSGNTGKKNNSLLKDFLSLKFLQRSPGVVTLFAFEFYHLTALSSSTCSGYLNINGPPPKT